MTRSGRGSAATAAASRSPSRASTTSRQPRSARAVARARPRPRGGAGDECGAGCSWGYRRTSSALEVKGWRRGAAGDRRGGRARRGIAPSALRYYEEQGLITRRAGRPGGARRYPRSVLRRLAFIRAAPQRRAVAAGDPRGAGDPARRAAADRAPTGRGCRQGWRDRLDEQIAALDAAARRADARASAAAASRWTGARCPTRATSAAADGPGRALAAARPLRRGAAG